MTQNIRVSINQNNAHHVRFNSKQKIKAKVEIMPKKLEELLDVDVSGVKDSYLIMYNSTTKKYIAVNPDDVLSAAANDTEQPGLPSDFINDINLDGGSF